MNVQEPTKPESAPAEVDGTERGMQKPYKIWEDPSQFGETEVQASYISGAFLGIVLAGFAYPFFMGVAILFFQTTYYGSFDQLIMGVVFVVFYGILGGAVGIVISSITGMFSIALIIVINWSLGYPINARSAAISAGSLAGYAPTVWILFTPGPGGSGFPGQLVAGFLGPVLAMTLGAIGAAWASSKFGGFDFNVATRRNRFKLSIMHIMIATAWIAVTFAIANFLGGPEFAIAAAGWFVLQGFLLGIIHTLRKIGMQRSSTQ